MAVAVVLVERWRDGKLHPAGGYLPRPERAKAIRLAHRCRCRDGLSFRQVQRALESFGIRRSVGQIHADVVNYVCDLCADGPPEPEPAAAPQQPSQPADRQQPASPGGGWAGPAPW